MKWCHYPLNISDTEDDTVLTPKETEDVTFKGLPDKETVDRLISASPVNKIVSEDEDRAYTADKVNDLAHELVALQQKAYSLGDWSNDIEDSEVVIDLNFYFPEENPEIRDIGKLFPKERLEAAIIKMMEEELQICEKEIANTKLELLQALYKGLNKEDRAALKAKRKKGGEDAS